MTRADYSHEQHPSSNPSKEHSAKSNRYFGNSNAEKCSDMSRYYGDDYHYPPHMGSSGDTIRKYNEDDPCQVASNASNLGEVFGECVGESEIGTVRTSNPSISSKNSDKSKSEGGSYQPTGGFTSQESIEGKEESSFQHYRDFSVDTPARSRSFGSHGDNSVHSNSNNSICSNSNGSQGYNNHPSDRSITTIRRRYQPSGYGTYSSSGNSQTTPFTNEFRNFTRTHDGNMAGRSGAYRTPSNLPDSGPNGISASSHYQNAMQPPGYTDIAYPGGHYSRVCSEMARSGGEMGRSGGEMARAGGEMGTPVGGKVVEFDRNERVSEEGSDGYNRAEMRSPRIPSAKRVQMRAPRPPKEERMVMRSPQPPGGAPGVKSPQFRRNHYSRPPELSNNKGTSSEEPYTESNQPKTSVSSNINLLN